MKRTSLILKTLICVVVFALSIGIDSYVAKAQKSGCNTTQACTGVLWCTCGDSDCGGCYIPNGQGGCGTCRSR